MFYFAKLRFERNQAEGKSGESAKRRMAWPGNMNINKTRIMSRNHLERAFEYLAIDDADQLPTGTYRGRAPITGSEKVMIQMNRTRPGKVPAVGLWRSAVIGYSRYYMPQPGTYAQRLVSGASDSGITKSANVNR